MINLLTKKAQTKIKSRIRTAFGVLFLIISAFIIVVSMSIKQATQKTILNYEENSDVLYKVYYHGKSYVDNNNDEYLSNQIETIKTNFNYNFLADAKFDCNYTYTITGHLIVKDGATTIWNHDIEILNETAVETKKSNGFKIIEFFDLDYREFEQIVREKNPSYQSSYKTDLILTLNILVDGKYPKYNEKIKGQASLTMIVPLLENKTKITIDHNNIHEESVQGIEDSAIKNIFLFLIGLIVFISAVVVIINEFLGAVKEDKKLIKYRAAVKNNIKMLNEVVRLKKVPDLDGKTIKTAPDISIIIAVQKEVRTPVIVAEKIKNQETWFVIFHNQVAYIYILTK